MIILHNSNDSISRAYVLEHGDGNTVIDWYNDPVGVKTYLAAGHPPPDKFPFVVASPNTQEVRTECARRLALGFDYDFQDARGAHHIGTTERDMVGWDAVTKIAQAAINLGLPGTTIDISTDTGVCTITAMEWQRILLAGGVAQQPIWQASFVLQAMDSIPSDYTNDKYWARAK